MADEASSKAEESVPTPQPHDRSRPDPDDEEDPVDKMIKDTGCLELHYAVQVNESGWADDAMHHRSPRWPGLATGLGVVGVVGLVGGRGIAADLCKEFPRRLSSGQVHNNAMV